MPQTISLICYDRDFSNSSPVNLNLLKAIVTQTEKLRLEEEESRYTLIQWNEDEKEWLPLLWIEPESSYAYINANPIFTFGLYYELVDVAELLEACILAEDGMVLFIPKYGLLYDPDKNEDLAIEIGALQAEIAKTKSLALSVKNIIANRQKEKYKSRQQIVKKQQSTDESTKTIAKSEAILEAKKYYILAAIFIVMSILLLLKKVTK